LGKVQRYDGGPQFADSQNGTTVGSLLSGERKGGELCRVAQSEHRAGQVLNRTRGFLYMGRMVGEHCRRGVKEGWVHDVWEWRALGFWQEGNLHTKRGWTL